VKPADLQPGQRIPTPALGILTVIEKPWTEIADNPDDSRIEVDVDLEYTTPFGDPDVLAAEVGAWAAQFLSLRPLRYRLFFLPDTDVEVE
jgi:hypothetical protein